MGELFLYATSMQAYRACSPYVVSTGAEVADYVLRQPWSRDIPEVGTAARRVQVEGGESVMLDLIPHIPSRWQAVTKDVTLGRSTVPNSEEQRHGALVARVVRCLSACNPR